MKSQEPFSAIQLYNAAARSSSETTAPKQKAFQIDDRRGSTVTQRQLMAVIQRQVGGHANQCGCDQCSGAATTQLKTIEKESVAQLTCDDGHKQHPKGPCPKTPAGKMNRMAKTHGGGKAHGKSATRPKAREAQYKAKSLANVQSKMGGPG